MAMTTPDNIPNIEQMMDDIINRDRDNETHTRLMEQMTRNAQMAQQQPAPNPDDPFGLRTIGDDTATAGNAQAINADELRRMHEQMRADAGVRGQRAPRFERQAPMPRQMTSDTMIFQLFENRQDILEWLTELANEVSISLRDTLVLLIDEAIKMNESDETNPMLRDLNKELNKYQEEGDGIMDEAYFNERSKNSRGYGSPGQSETEAAREGQRGPENPEDNENYF